MFEQHEMKKEAVTLFSSGAGAQKWPGRLWRKSMGRYKKSN
jgi:hypothetical protein